MDRYWDEYSRYLPAALIGLAIIVILVALTTGGNDRSVKREDNAARTKPAKQPPSKPAKAAPTGPTSGVTPQSTERVSGPHDDPVPILTYNVIKQAPATAANPELWVSPADFKAQMRWLANNGYTGITMSQLFKYWDDGFKLPAKPIVISFDDGYPSQAGSARRALASHRWPGVLFLRTGSVGDPDSGLTSRMIRALIAAGWEINSNTTTRPDLTTVGAAQLETETVGARQAIERMFDRPAEFFAYPDGQYNDAAIAAVRDAGYKGAVTDIDGIATPTKPFELARIAIKAGDGVDGLALKLRTAGQ